MCVEGVDVASIKVVVQEGAWGGGSGSKILKVKIKGKEAKVKIKGKEATGCVQRSRTLRGIGGRGLYN